MNSRSLYLIFSNGAFGSGDLHFYGNVFMSLFCVCDQVFTLQHIWHFADPSILSLATSSLWNVRELVLTDLQIPSEREIRIKTNLQKALFFSEEKKSPEKILRIRVEPQRLLIKLSHRSLITGIELWKFGLLLF